jgi:hypothetical protein
MSEFTVEDQLVQDLVSYWNTSRPAGISANVAIVHFRRNNALPIPAIIIGHEGFKREKAKGMTGTGHVNLLIALRTDLDVTTAADHHAMAGALDAAIAAMATQPGPLALTYLHAFLREDTDSTVVDRRQITLLRYTVVATRCSA